MKSSLKDMLCCPTCTGDLELQAFSEETVPMAENFDSLHYAPRSSQRVVKEGVLICGACRVWYPILEYIPVMLTFATQVHERFAANHQQEMAGFADCAMPAGKPNAGERSVQETFSDEWERVQEDELSFQFTADDLVQLNRQVWLRPLQETRNEFKTVLNVGVGLGQETLAVQKAVGNAEIVGVDLNFALLRQGRRHRTTSKFHLVIASLFHLPFRRASFDVVYSQGVLHHTYSTHAAFDSIANFVRPEGHLFIWVYALDSHLLPKGFKRLALRASRQADEIMRPVISSLPKALRDVFFTVLTTLSHPLIKMTAIHPEKWSWRNTDHNLRDWLSPRYAHRHSYNEVMEWFEDHGFEIAGVQSPAAYRRLFGKQLYGVGVLGRLAEDRVAAEVRERCVTIDRAAPVRRVSSMIVPDTN